MIIVTVIEQGTGRILEMRSVREGYIFQFCSEINNKIKNGEAIVDVDILN